MGSVHTVQCPLISLLLNIICFSRTEAVVKQMSAMDKSLPEMATLRSSESKQLLSLLWFRTIDYV